jgi:hypothetical protein
MILEPGRLHPFSCSFCLQPVNINIFSMLVTDDCLGHVQYFCYQATQLTLCNFDLRLFALT